MENKLFYKDTVIIANYIDIRNFDLCDVPEYLAYINERLKIEGNIIQYAIPITDGDSYIDCVYPKYLVSEEEFNCVNEELKLIEEKLINIILKNK